MVACVIAACEAPVPECGSCCDWDCWGALGWSWAASGTMGARKQNNTRITLRVVIGRQVAGSMLVGQAHRLPVADALWAAFNARESATKMRFAPAFAASAWQAAKRLQLRAPQAKRVRDHRNRAEAHGCSGNH